MFWSTLSPAAESALPEFQAFYDNTQRAAAERAAEKEREAQAAALAASNAETTETTEEAAEDEFASASEAHVTILTVVMPSDELGIDFDVPPEPLATSEAATSAASSAETAAAELTPEQQREQMLRVLHDATAEEVAAKIAEAEYTFPVLLDTTGDVFAAYRTTELPCTYVITPDGVIAGRVVGALTASQLDRIVQEGVQSYDARQLELIEMQKAASTASALAASIVNTASEDATSEEESAS
jgi:hypothetical protein